MNHLVLLTAFLTQLNIGEEIELFSPRVPVKTFSTLVTRSSVAGFQGSPLETAKQFVSSNLGFSEQSYVVKNSYTSSSNGVTHVYLRQVVDGKEVFNSDINVNVKNNKVMSFGDSFARFKDGNRARVRYPKTKVTSEQATAALLKKLGRRPAVGFSKLGSPASNQGWIQMESGELEPVWEIQLPTEEDYFQGFVSVLSLEVVSLDNWVKKASYRVLPFPIVDPKGGERKLLVDPFDTALSPLGWHDSGTGKSTSTEGNNVVATKVSRYNPQEEAPSTQVHGGDDAEFDFEFDDSKSPDTYTNASLTNLFYWTNTIHDLYYRYGFNEEAGNFQKSNFDKGGKEGDRVIAHGQDKSSSNNAYFSTPPDGQSGHMGMFIFNIVKPNRDGSFETGIITHEYSHGLSIRLTGGPANSGCLSGQEAGGMGEGWGDLIATILRTNSSHTRSDDMPMGPYVLNRPTIRKYIYSTNMETNPSLYSYLNKYNYREVHASGELWTAILFEVYWNLRDKLGFESDWFLKDKSPESAGNTLMLQIVIDAMKLQPCRPTFIQARDAIIQAESALTEGKHSCELWKGFAKRGLGTKANDESSKTDSFDIPEECN